VILGIKILKEGYTLSPIKLNEKIIFLILLFPI
jgi:hypothetical protein